MQGKRLKLHENIIKSADLLKIIIDYATIQSEHSDPINRQHIDNTLNKFEPEFSKINFTKMLFSDDFRI